MNSPTDSLGFDLTVTGVVEETRDSMSFVLTVPEAYKGHFDYRPGQFLTVRIPSERTGSVARCYSLSSSPGIDRDLIITVKRTALGYGSNWLCDNIRAGDTLHVLPPSGSFVSENLSEPHLIFAGGSGITPLMSIMKSVLVTGSGTISLFYANRDSDSIIFERQIDQLVTDHPDRMAVVHWLESESGVPTPAAIGDFSRGSPHSKVYVCGPEPFMDCVRSAASDLGYDHHDVKAEEFKSLTGDPFRPIAPIKPHGADVSTVRVTLEGEEYRLRWPEGTTLVDVMIDADIKPPYSCREGECGSCMATLTAGEVDLGNVEILDPEDIEEGQILACQATPRSRDIAVEF